MDPKTHNRVELLKAHSISREEDRCEHPDAPIGCQGDIVNAHVLQRGNILESVAEKGHVLTFRVAIDSIFKKGPDSPQSVGIRNASTFGGYCSFHDREAFADIEKTAIVPTRFQAFLLTYRALVSEMRSKREAIALGNSLRVTGLDSDSLRHASSMQRWLDLRTRAAEFGLRELANLRTAADKALKSRDASEFNFLAVTLAGPPVLVASQAISPEYGFSTSQLQDVSDLTVPLHGVLLSIVPHGDNTLVVIGWHSSGDSVGSTVAKSLRQLPQQGVADALHRFAFANAEFVYFRPSWWDSQDRIHRHVIADLTVAGVSRPAKPSDHLPNSCRLSNAPLIEIADL